MLVPAKYVVGLPVEVLVMGVNVVVGCSVVVVVELLTAAVVGNLFSFEGGRESFWLPLYVVMGMSWVVDVSCCCCC